MTLLLLLYKRAPYIILSSKSDNRYIVRNINKKFQSGHTHVNNYQLAKKLIGWVSKEIIPQNPKPYVVESLIRLSNNQVYITKLQSLNK